MKKIFYKMSGLVIIAFTLCLNSCTNLDETVYSEIVDEAYYNNAEEIMAAYLAIYAPLQAMYEENYFNAVEFSTDECARPTKVQHGYDGGRWIRLHRHEWLPNDQHSGTVWNLSYRGIGFASSNLEQFEKLDFEKMNIPLSKERIAAECRAMRAYYYYILCDLFGGVPLTVKVGEPKNPERNTRKEVFDFAVSELLAVIDQLPAKGDKDAYGKMTQGAARAILAKLYLNAKEWTGEDRWEDCIAACNNIIASGKYEMDPTWQYPFRCFNEDSEENIFIIPYDQINSTQFNVIGRSLHYSHQQKYKMVARPSNGIVTEANFYGKFKPNDKRIEQWLVGPQFNFDGTPLLCTEEYKGQQLVLNPEVISMELGQENSGVRNVKFEIQLGSQNGVDNDFPVVRYADILLMKAECLLRQNKMNEALTLINQVRARCFEANDPDREYKSINLDEFLDERAREFAYECWRRQDLIRFGKFATTWWDKTSTDETKKLFPIPEDRIKANPNLKQNPGYAGYEKK